MTHLTHGAGPFGELDFVVSSDDTPFRLPTEGRVIGLGRSRTTIVGTCNFGRLRPPSDLCETSFEAPPGTTSARTPQSLQSELVGAACSASAPVAAVPLYLLSFLVSADCRGVARDALCVLYVCTCGLDSDFRRVKDFSSCSNASRICRSSLNSSGPNIRLVVGSDSISAWPYSPPDNFRDSVVAHFVTERLGNP